MVFSVSPQKIDRIEFRRVGGQPREMHCAFGSAILNSVLRQPWTPFTKEAA